MSRLLCTAALMLVASVAHAQTVTHHDDRTVTVRAESVPIAALLAEITRDYPIDRVTIQPGHEQQPVSIVLERAAPAAALVVVLKASGLDFAISGRRIVIGDWTLPAGLKAGRYMQSESSSSDAAQDVRSGRPSGRPANAEPQPQEDRQAAERAAAAAADLTAWHATADESTILPMPPVQFIANGENITYLEANFVPYKMRPHVRALRMAIDVATIP